MSTSKKRYIRDEMWSDNWFYSLDTASKLTWVYLLTNVRCNVAGVYKLNRSLASKEIGVGNKQLEGSLMAFQKAKKVLLIDDWVVIVNFTKHQVLNPSVKQGISRILKDVPQAVTACIQAAHNEGTDCSTLLNFTLPNLTLPNGESPEEFFEAQNFTEEDMKLAQLLADLIKRNNPDWQLRGKIETWAEHIEKLRRIDKRTSQQIEFMIRWTQDDDFWQQNILSTAKLRQKFNDLIPKVKASVARKARMQQQASKPKSL